jgi:proteasome lid subunit RPN8/RPN11
MQGAGVRESGAFLLGHKAEAHRVVTRFLPYEHLQTDALHDDYVSLSAGSFSKLWDLCRAEGLSVVADVHTHRLGPGQSRSDRANPMVAVKGHVALIVPHFARGKIRLQDLGMYVYQGNHMWTAYSGSSVRRLLRLTEGGETR